MSLQSVRLRQCCFPLTPPVTLAACAVVLSQTHPCPPHDAASYDHLGPGSKAQTSRSYFVYACIMESDTHTQPTVTISA